MPPKLPHSHLWLFLAPVLFSCASRAGPASDPMAMALERFLGGELPAKKLVVIYSDLHQFHGGLELSIGGDGKVEQQALREEVGETRDLTRPEVEELARLLLELEAWRQLEPERMAVPDESRATLSISAGEVESEIWEWFNDLEGNDRLIRIRETMKRLAWR